MGPLDFLMHLGGFLAPAAGVALLVSLSARLMLGRNASGSSWWSSAAIDFVAGSAALVAGLVLFGRDGKMLTYAALVLACATSQWLISRNWK